MGADGAALKHVQMCLASPKSGFAALEKSHVLGRLKPEHDDPPTWQKRK